jgi:hypothetical protein
MQSPSMLAGLSDRQPLFLRKAHIGRPAVAEELL